MKKTPLLGALLLLTICSLAFAQGGFDYASYPLRDADQLIASAPKVESALASPEGRQMFPPGAMSPGAMRIIRPEKLRLQGVLAAEPSLIRSDGGVAPYEHALRVLGVNPPPPARYAVSITTHKGAVLRAAIQDVLVDALKKEVPVGGKVTVYALLIYYDKDGPGLLVNEFNEGWK